MTLEYCDQHKLDTMNDLIASRYSGCKIALFTNNHTPAHGDTLASYTLATFTGFSPITLSSWPAASLDGSFAAVSTHPSVTFTQTGTGTTNLVYGALLMNAAGTQLIGAELNPNGPQNMNATGLTYVCAPTVGDSNQTPP